MRHESNLCEASECARRSTDQDGVVEFFHLAPVEENRLAVVRDEICVGHLHLTLFEKELDRDVRQEVVLLLAQA